MRINNNYDDELYKPNKSEAARIIFSVLGAFVIIASVLAAVFYSNKDMFKKQQNRLQADATKDSGSSSELDIDLSEEKITADDLDFWNMYDDGGADVSKKRGLEPEKSDSSSSAAENKSSSSSSYAGFKKAESDDEDVKVSGVLPAENDEEKETFNAADSVNEEDAEYVEICESVDKNSYTADGFRQENSELQYFSANRKISSYGIDVSKYQGEIDWEKVADAGIDFAMIRMGVRGYSSGTVVADEQFKDNIEGATSNGIDVGIYFYSQATTVEEAVEEANYAVAAARPYNVTYPIVFYSEKIVGDYARTDDISADALAEIAKTFCDTVRGYGYKPMISGSKHRLAVDMDISALNGYDTWLLDAPLLKEGEKLSISEYPYQYTMWQYSSTGHIDGIKDEVDLNISFVDYKYR